MTGALVLVSHALCPYVQRAAIVLAEKGLRFERRDIDLARKPGWFLAVSPLGKMPVLLVEGAAIFESSVICEYLEDTALPRLHPGDAIQRARHRAWMEFGSALLNAVGAFYSAPDEVTLQARAADIRARLMQVEAELGRGPYFAGRAFGMVDAAIAPAFRYFDIFDGIGDFGFCDGLSKVRRWREALAVRPSVVEAVSPEYGQRLRAFLRARGSALSRRMDSEITEVAARP
ncbi:MAG: glutathione S-transferase family protein [Rhodoferax sp.]|nr:glutathione S-transferase family protein [Rhodoferax sp.]